MHQHLSRFIGRMDAISIHKAKHQQLINNKQYKELFRYSEHNSQLLKPFLQRSTLRRFCINHSNSFFIEQCNEQCHQLSAAYLSLWELSQSGVNICIIKIKQYKNIRTLPSVDPLSKHLIPKQCQQIHYY